MRESVCKVHYQINDTDTIIEHIHEVNFRDIRTNEPSIKTE